ncbi:MAG: hypothetical protein EBR62_03975 [Verrucomicrobia bacterium]|nr:hypothetical protein [Verrucomicrobiota bacterium]
MAPAAPSLPAAVAPPPRAPAARPKPAPAAAATSRSKPSPYRARSPGTPGAFCCLGRASARLGLLVVGTRPIKRAYP